MSDETTRFWVSFDLGLRGEYTDLFAWLDKHQARECGENVATFKSLKSRDQIAKEIGKLLRLDSNSRIYIIDMRKGGKFYFGRRKVAPWTGYGQTSIESDDET